MSYQSTILAESGLAWYCRLNESSGTTFADSFGSKPGTLNGGITLGAAGAFDQAATFDGSTGYITVPTTPVTAVTGVALEAWFRTADFTQHRQAIVYNGSDASANGYGLFVNKEDTADGSLRFLYGGKIWVDSGIKVLDSFWHHVVLNIISGSSAEVWLDGIRYYNSNPTQTPNTPAVLQVGTDRPSSTAYWFKGQIAEAAAYTSTLSAAQIAAHYAYYTAPGLLTVPARPPTPVLNRTGVARGLVVCGPMGQHAGNPKNLVDGSSASVGVGSFQTGPMGRDFSLPSSTSNNATQWTHRAVDRQSFTAELWLTPRTWNTTSPYLRGLWYTSIGSGSGDPGMRFSPVNSPPLDRVYVYGLTSASRPLTLNRPHQIVLTSGPGGRALYLDGQLQYTGSALTAGTTFTTSNAAAEPLGTTYLPDGFLHQYNLWDRPLAEGEVAQRWADPWGLVRPRRLPIAMLGPSQPASRVPRRSDSTSPAPREPLPAYVW